MPDGYRAHLDGLRTVAVYLVVAFHAGVGSLANGFIGVDVFFVLSGYLVTLVLVRDVTSNGSIRFARFYARRFRRLLPAAALALLGSALVYAWVASPRQIGTAAGAFRASFLYVANWHFISQATDYFAADTAESPVLHFWSLAVEEQFYLLWPLTLAGLVWLGGRSGAIRWGLVRWSAACLGLASLAWAWSLSTSDPTRAYYGTDARVYQMLAGVFVALTPTLVSRARRLDRLMPLAALGALVGILVLATPLVPMRPVARGVAVAICTATLLVALERRGGWVTHGLSRRTMVELGRISYGTYLWHWPVIILLTKTFEIGPIQTVLVAGGVSTGLAAGSALLVEVPVRTSAFLDRAPRLICVSALAASVVAALVVVPKVADPSRGQRPKASPATSSATSSGGPADDVALTRVPADFDETAEYDKAVGRVICFMGELCPVVEGSKGHMVLIGDSNARMFEFVFAEIAEAHDLTFTFGWSPGCAWQRSYESGVTPENKDTCLDFKDEFYERRLAELQPDLVVLISVKEARFLDDFEFQDIPLNREYMRTTRESIDRFVATGAKALVIEPIPRASRGYDPLACLALHEFQESCRFEVPDGPHWYESHLRGLAESVPELHVVDLDHDICLRLPSCDSMVGDQVIFRDSAHITRDAASTLRLKLDEAVMATGAFAD
ncbi:MAG: acyltransferase [Acidimicrobiales bacterium]|nr:acyltransferase [Acidimicrobiales bacterium]